MTVDRAEWVGVPNYGFEVNVGRSEPSVHRLDGRQAFLTLDHVRCRLYHRSTSRSKDRLALLG